MNKFMAFLKRNRKKLIVLFIILVIFGIFVFASYKLFKYLTPDTKNSVYGDRCELTDGIDITKERKDMVKDIVLKYEGMSLSYIDVECNLIKMVVIVTDTTEVAKVKEMANETLTVFTEEELKYYDIHLMVDSDAEESETYPIAGTRRKTGNGDPAKKFVW